MERKKVVDKLYNHLYSEVGNNIHGCSGPVVCLQEHWLTNLNPTTNRATAIDIEELYTFLDTYRAEIFTNDY